MFERGGLRAGQALGVLGVYPFLRVLPLAVSPLRRVPLANDPKEPKVWAPAYGTSLWLGVPSFRDSSGNIASGLLRCTSSRCVRLRRTALRAYPRINPSTQPAGGAGTSKALLELTLIVFEWLWAMGYGLWAMGYGLRCLLQLFQNSLILRSSGLGCCTRSSVFMSDREVFCEEAASV